MNRHGNIKLEDAF